MPPLAAMLLATLFKMKLKVKTSFVCSILLFQFSCNTEIKENPVSIKTDSNNKTTVASDQAIAIRVPPSSEKINFSNSPYLIIKLLSNKYQIYFQKDSLTTSNIIEIEKFIALRINKLNKDKTLLIGDSNGSLKNFKALKTILEKYKIYRFRIKTSDELY